MKPLPRIDLTTQNKDLIIIEHGVVTMKPKEQYNGFDTILPVLLEQPLANGQSFQVGIVVLGCRGFLVGVAVSELKNTLNQNQNPGSLALSGRDYLYAGPQSRKVDFEPKDGDTIRVTLNNGNLEWFKNGTSVCSITVPEELADKPLFPMCWLQSDEYRSQITKLRFIYP